MWLYQQRYNRTGKHKKKVLEIHQIEKTRQCRCINGHLVNDNKKEGNTIQHFKSVFTRDSNKRLPIPSKYIESSIPPSK